ncbi:AAA family ATPase, partial [Candidatus Woesearchaeota archaeon]|nr:AAA family ATPase [Candidatus Woesearchaeota archaeon]
MSKQAQKILILGRSGSGKSFSLHDLDPKKTGIINSDKQELSFGNPGYETVVIDAVSGAPDFQKSNMVQTDKMSSVVATFEAWETREDIETIIIDTLTHLITADYMANSIGKDF